GSSAVCSSDLSPAMTELAEFVEQRPLLRRAPGPSEQSAHRLDHASPPTVTAVSRLSRIQANGLSSVKDRRRTARANRCHHRFRRIACSWYHSRTWYSSSRRTSSRRGRRGSPRSKKYSPTDSTSGGR